MSFRELAGGVGRARCQWSRCFTDPTTLITSLLTNLLRRGTSGSCSKVVCSWTQSDSRSKSSMQSHSVHHCIAEMYPLSRRAFVSGVLLSKAYRPRAHQQGIRRRGALQVIALRYSFRRHREVEHQQVDMLLRNCSARLPPLPHPWYTGSHRDTGC